MSEEKQIEEMARDIEQTGMLDSYSRCEIVAEDLYNAGYRKQSEGEWRKDKNARTCSECGFQYWARAGFFGYCPNCGAKMKGNK